MLRERNWPRLYTTEKMIKENDAKIKEEDKVEVKSKIENLKTELGSDKLDDIKKASDELSKVAQRVGTALYQQEQAKPKEEPQKAEETKPAEEKKEEGK